MARSAIKVEAGVGASTCRIDAQRVDGVGVAPNPKPQNPVAEHAGTAQVRRHRVMVPDHLGEPVRKVIDRAGRYHAVEGGGHVQQVPRNPGEGGPGTAGVGQGVDEVERSVERVGRWVQGSEESYRFRA